MSIRKKPSGKWEVRYRNEGGQARAKSFTRKGDAERFELDVKLRRERGELSDPSLGNTTVGEFYRSTFLPTRSTKASTQRNYVVRWKAEVLKPWHVAMKFDRMPLRSANTPATILDWHREMRLADATPSAMAGAHALLVQILKVAVDMEYLPRLRVTSMRPDYAPAPAAEPWLPETIEQVRGALAVMTKSRTKRAEDWAWERQRDLVFVSLMGYMPLRVGEAAALRWVDVLDGNRISTHAVVQRHVPHPGDPEAGTKTVADRVVEIPEPVRSELRAWRMSWGRTPTGIIAPYRKDGEPWLNTRLSSWRDQIWYRALEEAGLPRVPPKHLRHSAVSMWIRAGRDIKTVADSAGHSIEVCARTYTHSFARARRADDRFDLDAEITKARDSRVVSEWSEGSKG